MMLTLKIQSKYSDQMQLFQVVMEYTFFCYLTNFNNTVKIPNYIKNKLLTQSLKFVYFKTKTVKVSYSPYAKKKVYQASINCLTI